MQPLSAVWKQKKKLINPPSKSWKQVGQKQQSWDDDPSTRRSPSNSSDKHERRTSNDESQNANQSLEDNFQGSFGSDILEFADDVERKLREDDHQQSAAAAQQVKPAAKRKRSSPDMTGAKIPRCSNPSEGAKSETAGQSAKSQFQQLKRRKKEEHLLKHGGENSRDSSPVSKKIILDESARLNTDETSPTTCDRLSMSSWDLPESVLLRYAEVGITTMFKWQVECLLLGKVLSGGNLVYSAPTSAGKTLVAELLVLKRVLESKRKAIIILPFVSVAREKMHYLQRLFRGAGVRVGGYIGPHHPPGDWKAVDVAVCTIEKANGLINRLLQGDKLSQLGIVVVDELHMLGDSTRGYLLELLLTKVKYMDWKFTQNRPDNENATASIQIVGMSATLPNLDVLARWLDADLYQTDFRPIPLMEYVKFGDKICRGDFKPVRTIQTWRELQAPDNDHVVQLCLETILAGHSVLVFCPTKKWCSLLALNVAKEICHLGKPRKHDDMSKLAESLHAIFNVNSLKDTLEQLRRCPAGLDSELAKTIGFGTAFHHAGLTFDERDIIEGAFRHGAVKVLVATTTLSAGVNLPARRVIVRSPMFGRSLLDVLSYRQMIGRAGRMGIDTEGESILVCTSNEKSKAMELVKAGLRPVQSCLVDTTDSGPSSSMKRAILEVVVSGVASTPEQVTQYCKSTLLAASQSTAGDVKWTSTSVVDACICYLLDSEFIIRRKTVSESDGCEREIYIPTQLGRAILTSSFPPDQGLIIFRELDKARRNFILENELHIVYQVTPLAGYWDNIDWGQYLTIWQNLPSDQKRVGEMVGVEERVLFRLMRRSTAPSSEQYRQLAIHKRFYTAMALHDLVNEIPLKVVAEKYGCERGALQSLQQTASMFAGMVTSFARELGWLNVELLLAQFHSRLNFGIQQELCDLVRLPLLNGQRARLLYDGGLKTLSDLANAQTTAVEALLRNAGPFQSDKQRDDETAYDVKERRETRCIWLTGRKGLTEAEAARMLIEEARQVVEKEMGISVQWDELADSEKSSPVQESPDEADRIVPTGESLPVYLKTETQKSSKSSDEAGTSNNAPSPGSDTPDIEIAVAAELGDSQGSAVSVCNLPAVGETKVDSRVSTVVVEAEKLQTQVDIDTVQTAVATVKLEESQEDLFVTVQDDVSTGPSEVVTVKTEESREDLFWNVLERVCARATTNLNSSPCLPDDSFVVNTQLAKLVDGGGVNVSNHSRNESKRNSLDRMSVGTPSDRSRELFDSPVVPLPFVNKTSTPCVVSNAISSLSPNFDDSDICAFMKDYKTQPAVLLKEEPRELEPQEPYDAPAEDDSQPQFECGRGLCSPLDDCDGAASGGNSPKQGLFLDDSCSELSNDGHDNLGSLQLELTSEDSVIEPSPQKLISPVKKGASKYPFTKLRPYEAKCARVGKYESLSAPESCNDNCAVKDESVTYVHTVSANSNLLKRETLSSILYAAGTMTKCTEETSVAVPLSVEKRNLLNLAPGAGHDSKSVPEDENIRENSRRLSGFSRAASEPKTTKRLSDEFIPGTPPKLTRQATLTKSRSASKNGTTKLNAGFFHSLTYTSPKSPKTTRPKSPKATRKIEFPPVQASLEDADVESFSSEPDSDVDMNESHISDYDSDGEVAANRSDFNVQATPLVSNYSEPDLGEAFNIIDVTADKRIFDTFIREWRSQKRFSLCIACKAISASPSATIGSKMQKASSATIQNNRVSKDVYSFNVEDRNLTIVGVAISWEAKDAYFISLLQTECGNKGNEDLSQMSVDATILPTERIIALKSVLQQMGTDAPTIVAYNLKEQLRALFNGCGILATCPGEDPTVASWLMHPTSREEELRSLVKTYTPHNELLMSSVSGKVGAQSLGMLADHPSSPRQRAATEAVLVRSLMECLQENLAELKLCSVYTDIEMRCVHSLLKMELYGLGICGNECQAQLAAIEDKLDAIEKQASEIAGHHFSLSSRAAVATELYVKLRLPPNGEAESAPRARPNYKTSVGRKTNKETLEKLARLHPLPGLILDWRKLRDAKSNVVVPFLKHKCPSSHFNMDRVYGTCQYFTSTGRVAMHEPNIQSVNRDFALGFADVSRPTASDGDKNAANVEVNNNVQCMFNLRKAFVPCEGYLLLSADYSQLELRILAHLSKDVKLVNILNGGGDVLKCIAAQWKTIDVENVTSEDRQHAKQICYGMVYGMGVRALSDRLGVPENDAATIMTQFKLKYPGIFAYIENVTDECRQVGYVTTLAGRRRYLPSIASSKPSVRSQAERQAVNTTIQGSAADLFKTAMTKIDTALDEMFSELANETDTGSVSSFYKRRGRLVLQLHDELIFEVRKEDLHRIAAVVQSCMEGAMALSVKLPVRLKSGPSWGELKDLVPN